MTSLTWIAAGVVSTGVVLAGQLKIAPDQRYLAVMTFKTSTLQKELDQAAAGGFEVVFANWQGVLMKRSAAGTPPVEYHLTAVERIATLEKELNAAAQKGFAVVPGPSRRPATRRSFWAGGPRGAPTATSTES